MKKTVVLLATLAFLVPAVAHADAITVPGMGTYYTTVRINTTASDVYPDMNGNFYIGQIAITWNGQAYTGYCVDLFSDFNLGASWDADARHMTELPLAGIGGTMNPPYATPLTGAHAAWVFSNYGNSVNSGSDAAAMQMALWLTIFPQLQTSWFDFGSDPANTTIRTLALNWSQAGANNTSDAVWLDSVRAANSQDFIVTTPVPEPASLVLFGIGLIGVAGLTRRVLAK